MDGTHTMLVVAMTAHSHPNCRSLSLRPDSETLHHLASFYHNTGRLREAKTAFRESLDLNPLRTETACALVSELLFELTSLVPLTTEKSPWCMYLMYLHTTNNLLHT